MCASTAAQQAKESLWAAVPVSNAGTSTAVPRHLSDQWKAQTEGQFPSVIKLWEKEGISSFFEFLPTCPTKKLCVHNIVLKVRLLWALQYQKEKGKITLKGPALFLNYEFLFQILK